MPNNGRITLCPFYRDEKNLSISCEDTFRRFRWPAQKKAWLDEKCDKDWKNCPYAKDLMEVYDQMGENDMENEILKLEHEKKALEKELRKVASLLGKASKRERAKEETIKTLRNENRAMEQLYLRYRKKNDELLERNDNLAKECMSLAKIYDDRLAYLMANYSDGILDETAAREWGQKYEYRIEAVELTGTLEEENVAVKTWKVVIREHEDEHTVGAPAAEDERAGDEETESAGDTCEGDSEEEVQE